MSTEVAEQTEGSVEGAIAQPDQRVVYLSRRSDLRLIRVARQPRHNVAGMKIGEDPGQAVQFVEGKLTLPLEGKVRIDQGREADAVEIREWLEGHHIFGNVEEGFWRVDPAAPPLSAAEMSMFQELVLKLDVEGLRRCLEAERNGWARTDIVAVLEESIEKVGEVVEEARRAHEEETAAGDAEAKGK